jgi:hypothetical protein
MQASMQMNHLRTAGSFMKVVNILSDHRQIGHIPGKLSDSEMSTVWLRLQNLVPTPFVPSPTQ